VPLPADFFTHRDQWRGGAPHAVFLCPAIAPGTFYGRIYDGIKRDFGDLPHVIFGRQTHEVPDPAVLPYLTDDELTELYRTAPVFCYPHTEPRHIHYSPLEAVVVGTPTLYLRGALMDMLLGGADLPAACADTAEMAAKARRLIAGDRALAEAIRATQGRVLDAFDTDLARRQWAAALPPRTALPGTAAAA
jgi:glycosyltransferase involved in cell wall biosynthesis